MKIFLTLTTANLLLVDYYLTALCRMLMNSVWKKSGPTASSIAGVYAQPVNFGSRENMLVGCSLYGFVVLVRAERKKRQVSLKPSVGWRQHIFMESPAMLIFGRAHFCSSWTSIFGSLLLPHLTAHCVYQCLNRNQLFTIVRGIPSDPNIISCL